jgi:hypothetical protein
MWMFVYWSMMLCFWLLFMVSQTYRDGRFKAVNAGFYALLAMIWPLFFIGMLWAKLTVDKSHKRLQF